MGLGFPQEFSFQWKILVDRVEERPLCRILTGKIPTNSVHQVLCYDFRVVEDFVHASRLLQALGQYRWFEKLKSYEVGGLPAECRRLTLETVQGPPLQEVLTQVAPAEQLRLCLELAKAIEVLHQLGLAHGNLDGDQVIYDPLHAIPVIRRTVCGFFRNQVAESSLPPERRFQENFVANAQDDIWQLGALYLKRVGLRNAKLSRLVFLCTHPQPKRRPAMSWIVKELEQTKPESFLGRVTGEASFFQRLAQRLGLGILALTLVLMLQPEPPQLGVPVRERSLSQGVMPLIHEPGPRTLGESAQDLAVLLGKPIVMKSELENRQLSPKTWMIWDQMLKEMGLTWRVTPDGAIEILEQGTLRNF